MKSDLGGGGRRSALSLRLTKPGPFKKRFVGAAIGYAL